MNKKLKYGLVGTLLILVALFVALSLSLDSLIKNSIESVGSEMTQTSVTVESVSVSPWSGSGRIEGLKVNNPEGFEQEYAYVMGSMSISLQPASLLSDTIRIEEIVITEPAISVIQKVPQNNLLMLSNNMDEAMQSGESSSTAMIIDLLRIEEGTVTVTPTIGGEKSARVELGTLELTGLGENDSSSSRQVVKMIADRIVNQALKVALSGELNKLKEKARDAMDDLFN